MEQQMDNEMETIGSQEYVAFRVQSSLLIAYSTLEYIKKSRWIVPPYNLTLSIKRPHKH